MKFLSTNEVMLNDAELDAVAYFSSLLSEGKSIAVAAYWALRSAYHTGQRLTTEFALWLSEETLTLDEYRLPVINRFAPLGVDTVQQWLDQDPQIAAVYGRHLSIAAEMAVYDEEVAALIAAPLDLDEPVGRTPIAVPKMARIDDLPVAETHPEPVFPA